MNSQKNIYSGGDVAGGNINKSQTIVYNTSKTRLGGLIEQLRNQIGEDRCAAEFVESLISWMNPKKTELRRDLATKLNECGKGHLLSDALDDKERFVKQLKRTAFNPALQEIYAYILGEIHSRFNLQIKPMISTSDEPGLIESKILELANTITSQIADAPVELVIGLPEVLGMLYYLTGNCYIEWEYNASVPSGD